MRVYLSKSCMLCLNCSKFSVYSTNVVKFKIIHCIVLTFMHKVCSSEIIYVCLIFLRLFVLLVSLYQNHKYESIQLLQQGKFFQSLATVTQVFMKFLQPNLSFLWILAVFSFWRRAQVWAINLSTLYCCSRRLHVQIKYLTDIKNAILLHQTYIWVTTAEVSIYKPTRRLLIFY